MKLIIDIHEEQYEFIKQGMPINKVIQFPALMEAICEHIAKGTPLDDVKKKIDKAYDSLPRYYPFALNTFAIIIDEILDNIGKNESISEREKRNREIIIDMLQDK